MSELIKSLSKIIERDLNKLEEEIKLYPTEASLWRVGGEIKNSGGNLCLHLCGNLRYYVGTVLGGTDYVRNRELEFTTKGVLRDKLVAEIQLTRHDVNTCLASVDVNVLDTEYPVRVFDYPMTTTYFLVHLAAHLGYHLGQVNYLRRLLSAMN